MPLNRFQMKIQILLSNFEKKVWNFWNPFLVKITMVNFVFHLKSDEGHIERFSFDVYMSPLPIFTKIKHPFAWHISFLVRHLRKYSEVWLSIKVIWVLKHICWRAFSLKHNVSTGFFVLTRITSHSRFFGQILSRYISRSTWFMFFTEEWWMFFS